MKVVGLNIDFNEKVIKGMSCKAFAELYKDRVPESLLIPAWEALTGKKYKRKAQARS
jgi:hypothetical protein